MALAVVTVRRFGGPKSRSFGLSHLYVEIVYGPLLGPAATVLARALDRRLGEQAQVEVDLRLLAHELGLRVKSTEGAVGLNSSVVKALNRLEHLQVVRLDGTLLEVRASVPPVPDRLLHRLPPGALAAHRRYTEIP